MARVLEVQSSFSSGEAEPRLSERRDVEFYYSALSRARNVVALAQGGITNLPGLRGESQCRNPVTSLGFSGATITMPNGGTASVLTNGVLTTVTTTSAAGAGTVVAVHVDLGSTKSFCAFDVYMVYAQLIARDQCLTAQWSPDNSAWTDIATFDIDKGSANARNRRFACPPGTTISARYIRLVTTGGSGLGTISIAEIRLMQEGAFTGVGRTINFNFRKDQEYTLVATPGNIDVFFGGVWAAAIASELTAAMLPEIDWTQKLDTLLIFHEDLETPQVKRQGRHTEWNFAPYPYVNVPLYDFGGTYVNGVNAKQRIQLFNISDDDGESFDLTLEGNTTTAIVRSTTPSTTAADIKAALEALPGVSAGLTVTHIAEGKTFDVTFTGGDNIARPWLVMSGTGLDEDGSVVVRELVKGKKAGEAAISATRGWPRTGIFWQQALIVAGLKSLPRHVMKSRIGEVDDFDIEITTALGGMFFEIDGGTANEIVHLHGGAALLVFFRDGVHYLDGTSLTPTSTPVFKPTEQPGIKRGLPLATLEGGLVYTETGGHIVRELKFSELARNFSAKNISVISAHLLDNPVDLSHRRAVKSQENDLVYLVNSDGTLVQMTALRSENITGFTLRSSQGLIKALTTDSEQNTRLLIARTTSNTARLWLERIDDGCVTEAAHVATGSGITSISVGTEFNGEVLHVFCDGAYAGTRTVAAGSIAGLPASDRIEAGFATLADVLDMPVLKDEEARRPMARQKRVFCLHLSLYETDHLAVQVNEGAVHPVPLIRLGGDLEIGDAIGDRPFTGTVHLEGFPGFTEGGQARLLQTRPGRFTVRQMRKEVRV